jgi:hypothetical protein
LRAHRSNPAADGAHRRLEVASLVATTDRSDYGRNFSVMS